MSHSCIHQMSHLFLFSPSSAQSSKPSIFIVTFYDRSFSSTAAASLLLRPFFAFLTVFLHNCSAMRELLPFLAPRFFQPLPIVIFLHFSYHDCVGVAFKLLHKKRSFRIIRGRQREPKSDPCARLQTQEM